MEENGILPIASLQDSKISTKNGDFDYRAYDKVEKVSPTQFTIRHVKDKLQDISVSLRVDEEENRVFWSGLPLPSEHFMNNFDYHFARQYP